jgi:hypothetical protein
MDVANLHRRETPIAQKNTEFARGICTIPPLQESHLDSLARFLLTHLFITGRFPKAKRRILIAAL